MMAWVVSIGGWSRTIDITVGDATDTLGFIFPYGDTPQWISDFSDDFNNDFGY